MFIFLLLQIQKIKSNSKETEILHLKEYVNETTRPSHLREVFEALQESKICKVLVLN